MKRTFHSMVALLLVALLMMSIGVTAYADDPELPTERILFDYGQPEAVPVPMHELEEEDITIDGISIDLYTDEGLVYITLVDLAAAKLLRDNAAKLLELGLSLDALYIKEGLILVKEDGLTADEIAALEEKVAELTNAVQVAVSVGDTFTLGNGETAALYVEIAGFTMPPVRKAAAPVSEPVEEPAEEPEEEPEPEPEPIVTPTPAPIVTPTPAPIVTPTPDPFQVEAGQILQPDSGNPHAAVKNPNVTTLYITYGAYFSYENGTTDQYQQNCDVYGTVREGLVVDVNQNFAKATQASYIYLKKSQDDTRCYYYSTDGETYTELEDCGSDGKK